MIASRAAEYRAKAAERAAIRSHITELKRAPCTDCGGTFDPVCMDFDHRPDEVKRCEVSSMTYAGWVRFEDVLIEIAKCDLVCANCHRLRTKLRAGWVMPVVYGPIFDTESRRAAKRHIRRSRAITIAIAEGSCSLTRLARDLGLTPNAVAQILRELVIDGVLARDPLLGFVPCEVVS